MERKMKTVFCPECRTDATYSVKHQKMSNTIKGREVIYNGEVACCSNCGSEVFVPAIHDSNLDLLYEKYRSDNKLISPEMISEILIKYNIGKRPLSILLGWGEQTVSRYLDGNIPSKKYSDVLMKIFSDPDYYYKLLEENNSNLASRLTYKKTLEAVEKLVTDKNSEQSDLYMIAAYVLKSSDDITHLTLQKALYYIQGFYYAFYEKYPIKEDCEAWAHGPVYRSIYDRYSDYRYDVIEKSVVDHEIKFSDMEKGIIDNVIKYYCCFSGKILEAFTHHENPWLYARQGLSVGESSNKIILKEKIGLYFSEIKEKYGMKNPVDISMYSLDMFNKVNG